MPFLSPPDGMTHKFFDTSHIYLIFQGLAMTKIILIVVNFRDNRSQMASYLII